MKFCCIRILSSCLRGTFLIWWQLKVWNFTDFNKKQFHFQMQLRCWFTAILMRMVFIHNVNSKCVQSSACSLRTSDYTINSLEIKNWKKRTWFSNFNSGKCCVIRQDLLTTASLLNFLFYENYNLYKPAACKKFQHSQLRPRINRFDFSSRYPFRYDLAAASHDTIFTAEWSINCHLQPLWFQSDFLNISGSFCHERLIRSWR